MSSSDTKQLNSKDGPSHARAAPEVLLMGACGPDWREQCSWSPWRSSKDDLVESSRSRERDKKATRVRALSHVELFCKEEIDMTAEKAGVWMCGGKGGRFSLEDGDGVKSESEREAVDQSKVLVAESSEITASGIALGRSRTEPHHHAAAALRLGRHSPPFLSSPLSLPARAGCVAIKILKAHPQRPRSLVIPLIRKYASATVTRSSHPTD